MHIACYKSTPISVIHELVYAWPESLRQTNNFGDLPLHDACRWGASFDVVQFLVVRAPDTVTVSGLCGRTPLDKAKKPDYGSMKPEIVSVLESVVAGRTDPTPTECAICFDEFTVDDTRPTQFCPFGHRFHQACVQEWVQASNNHRCPICRNKW